MQSVFVMITKLIASKTYFCKEVFCNKFGRDVVGFYPHRSGSQARSEYQKHSPLSEETGFPH